jgi:formylmethanofuran dehydrogenase subunit E
MRKRPVTVDQFSRALSTLEIDSEHVERDAYSIRQVLSSEPIRAAFIEGTLPKMDERTAAGIEIVRQRAAREIETSLRALPALRRELRAAQAMLARARFADLEPIEDALYDDRLTACARCGAEFTPARSDARYCSSVCRQAAYRQRHRNGSPAASP